MIKARWFYTYKSTFKGLLFILAMGLIVLEVWYIQSVVRKLREEQQEIVRFYAGLYSKVAEAEALENFSFLFDNIIKKINISVILSSPDGEPLSHDRIAGIEGPPYSPGTVNRLRDMITEMDEENPPIEIAYNTQVMSLIHYGDSALIKQLNWLPVVQVFMVGLFILLGFIGFNNIRRSEQRFIWVGMAKETAHQLGTPISSLIGWIELLKQKQSIQKADEIIEEMAGDTNRMVKVAQRFSQIGSSTDYAEYDISVVLHDIVQYFKRRLPRLKDTAVIEEQYKVAAMCWINKDLFEWSVENLIKNSLDAVENSAGIVTITLDAVEGGKKFFIDISDTGKGMTKKQQNQIFKPGFSTKKRGWGLGLTLAKRIIEDYHNGKLYVKNTKVNEGTTMRILLEKPD